MNGALHAPRMRKLLLWTSLLALALLAGCSSAGGHGSGGGDPAGNGAPPATSTAPTSPAAAAAGAGGGGAGDACSHGVKPTDPGVVDVNCGGTADVKVQVDSVSKDL